MNNTETYDGDSLSYPLQERSEAQDAGISPTLLVETVQPYPRSEFSAQLGYPALFFSQIVSYALRRKVVVIGLDGPPASGKTATGIQGDDFMFNVDIDPRLLTVAKHMGSPIGVTDVEWGRQYSKLTPDEIIRGDYHESPEKWQAKMAELARVGAGHNQDIRKAIENAKRNKQKHGSIEIIRYDKPLITGAHIDGKVIGTPRGDTEFRELLEEIQQDPDVELFVAGIYATRDVRRHTRNIRDELNKKIKLDDGSDRELTPTEKRQILVDLGVVYDTKDFPDDEIDERIANMAKPDQMNGISKDIDYMMDYLLKTNRIQFGIYDGEEAVEYLNRLKDEDPERYEEYYDDLVGQTVHWFLAKHIGVPLNRGAVFVNSKVIPIRNKKPNIPVIYRSLDEVA
jgi:hypothetical protein